MSSLTVWSRDAFVSTLALSLLHSLWQGTVFGVIALASHARLRRAMPDIRCGVYSTLLLAIFVVWLGTLGALYVAKVYPPTVTVMGLPENAAHFPTAAAPATSPAISSSVPMVYPLLVAIWAFGVCALSLRHLSGYLTLRRLCRGLSVPVSAEWQDCARRIAARLNLRRRFDLRASAQVDVPFACGLLRPCILLPIAALTGLAPKQVEALIAHELAHLARHDVFFNSLQVCVETILFYHPIVRYLSAQIRLAREQRCDDLAVQIVGDRAVYARALLSLEESRANLPRLALAAKGDNSPMSNSSDSPLVDRIQRILRVASPEKREPWSKSALALGAATVGLIAVLPAHAYSRHLAHKFAPPAGNPAHSSASGSASTSVSSGNTTVSATSNTSTVNVKTKILFNIGSDKVELDSTELKPDTLVTINGHRSRFAGLPAAQQEQIRKVMPRVSVKAGASHVVIGKLTQDKLPGVDLDLNINGKTIKTDSTEITPTTTIIVNGKETAFKNLTPVEQKKVTQALHAAHGDIKVVASVKTPDGKSSANPTVIVTSKAVQFDAQSKTKGDTLLTPDTMVNVNGKACRFGDLPADQQAIVKQAMSSVSVSVGSSH